MSEVVTILILIAVSSPVSDSGAAGVEGESRQCCSMVSLPTFVRNEERVPLEVLEMLTTHKQLYQVLLANYPNLLISSRSFSDSGRLHEQQVLLKPLCSELDEEDLRQRTVPGTCSL